MSHSPYFSHKMAELAAIQAHIFSVFDYPRMADLTPESCDFMFGNPQDMPVQGFVDALKQWSTPTDPTYFAYFSGQEHAQAVSESQAALEAYEQKRNTDATRQQTLDEWNALPGE